jgi:hypothetical protein
MPTKRVSRIRPAYFRGQLLDEADFQAEQDYHRDTARRHNSAFHAWGVVQGLTVTFDGTRRVSVSPGLAVDALGHEVILDEPAVVDLSGFDASRPVFVLLSYGEEPGESRATEHGEGAARVHELSVVAASTTGGADGAVTLARVDLQAGGKDGTISYADTPYASSLVGPGRVGARELSAGLQTGWVRLPFKPIPLEDKKPFRIGPTEARSAEDGAAGSMAIPVPPGMTRVQRFRIAGDRNEGVIRVEFFRCGWDPVGNDHEKSAMLSVEFDARTTTDDQAGTRKTTDAFRFTAPIDGALDPQYHALAVVVTATKKASISLIAVEFGYPAVGAGEE